MVNFRQHFRDLAGWAEYGLPLATTSNEAARLYDLALDQLVYYYDHPDYCGLFTTMGKMLEADADFLPGLLLVSSLKMFMSNDNAARAEFDDLCGRFPRDEMHLWHRAHVDAARCLYHEDLIGALERYSETSKTWPYDLHSLNLGFILGLVTGQSRYMRDIPLAALPHYKPHHPHYGLVHGKLCFGYAENGGYEEAERVGRTALAAFPLDSWALHSMVHLYENTAAPEKVVSVVEEYEKHWTRGVNFAHHIYWHKAIGYAQLGEYETALSLYDGEILDRARGGDSFPLSDASSLLMRLKVDGVETKGREEELVPLWSKLNNSFTSLFYDGHVAFTSAMTGDVEGLHELGANMRSYLNCRDRSGWNKEVTGRYGLQLVTGLEDMARGEYSKATDSLIKAVPPMISELQGSKSQKSVFSIILAHCAVMSGDSGHLDAAVEHLEAIRLENKAENLLPIQQRLVEKINKHH